MAQISYHDDALPIGASIGNGRGVLLLTRAGIALALVGKEYLTCNLDLQNPHGEWNLGHYFTGNDGLAHAIEDYKQRVEAKLQ